MDSISVAPASMPVGGNKPRRTRSPAHALFDEVPPSARPASSQTRLRDLYPLLPGLISLDKIYAPVPIERATFRRELYKQQLAIAITGYAIAPESAAERYRKLVMPSKRMRPVPLYKAKVETSIGFSDFHINNFTWGTTSDTVVAGAGSFLAVVNVRTNKAVLVQDVVLDTWSVAASPEGLFVGGLSGEITMLSPDGAVRVRSIYKGPGDQITAMDTSPWSVIAGTLRGDIVKCDIAAPNSCLAVYHPETGDPVRGIARHADRTTLAVGFDSGVVRLFDARRPGKEFAKLAPYKSPVKALCWSPQVSTVLFTGGATSDPVIGAWSITGGSVQCIDTAREDSQITSIRVAPETDELVCTRGYEPALCLWRCPGFKRTCEIKMPYRVLGSAVSPNGRDLATFDEMGTVRMWNLWNIDEISNPMTTVVHDPNARTHATKGIITTLR